MKIIILVLIAIAFTIGVNAQTDSINRKMNHPSDIPTTTEGIKNNQNKPVDKSHPDGVIMQNGKMMLVKDGKMTGLDHDMTMNNGTKVMSDGTCINKDGSKMMMKEGQRMDMSGNIVPIKKSNYPAEKSNINKDKMYIVPDSTIKKDNNQK